MQGTGLEATIQKEPTLLSEADSAAVIAYLQLFRCETCEPCLTLLMNASWSLRHAREIVHPLPERSTKP